ncbi:MAG: hypothetical protein AB7M12_05755 [Hyphomonadaceae bacterium]
MSAPEPPSGAPDDTFVRARKRRNALIAVALLAFVVLVFLVTIAKLKAASGI